MHMPAHRYSFNILIQMLIAILVLLTLAFAVQTWFLQTYVQFQATPIGIIINSVIVVVFVIGLLHIAYLLTRYMHEEKALSLFQTHSDQRDPLESVPPNSFISQRYLIMQSLYQQKSSINQAALAASLSAIEKAKTYVPRFINNTLILLGVFGTVVSLSMALTGSAGLLQSSVNEEGMGMVIHGMSTALSTTITAILCYVFFNYFFNALQHAQSHIFAQLENITSLYLIPVFQTDHSQVNHHLVELIQSLKDSVAEQHQARSELQTQLSQSQEHMQQWEVQMNALAQHSQAIADALKLHQHNEDIGFADLHQVLEQMTILQSNTQQQNSQNLQQIQSLLQQGFRLTDTPL
ncbi:MAG: MotA/TolQ/ExbB proton channel family protein [Mariprofundaceae bacterium]|nr:MotA/TolQ/ExbB proton channel family protein [Mariprofundaceae bacterium]